MQEITKKSKLELLLIDPEGNTKKEIIVKPVFFSQPLAVDTNKELFPWQMSQEGIVSIGIEIANVGDIPVYDIMISLGFPKECELFSKADVECPFTGDLKVEIPSRKKPTEGGLHISPENKSEAHAWVETLRNDHKTSYFDEVYVRFPEAEQNYRIKAKVTYRPLDELSLTLERSLEKEQKTEATQDEPLSENFEFFVTAKPEVR